MGAYRNYSLLSTFFKRIVVIRIIAEMFISITIDMTNIAVIYIKNGSAINAESLISYITEIFMILKTLTVVIGSVAQSASYKLYFENFQIIYNRCKNNPSYVEAEKRLRIKCFMCLGILITILLLFFLVEIQNSQLNHFWIFVIEKTHYVMIECRFMVEIVVAYCIITGIYEFLRILNNSVRTVIQHYESPGRVQIYTGEQEASQISEIVNTWRELYQYNLACAEHTSNCFCTLVRIRK